MRHTWSSDLLSRNEGLKQGKINEIKQAISDPKFLCHVMATRPYTPFCSSFLGKGGSADPLLSGHSWLKSIILLTHKALIKYMLIIILADTEGRLSATLRYKPQKKSASLIRSNKIQNETLWVDSQLLLDAGETASSKDNPTLRGQHQFSLAKAQPKLLFPMKVRWQFFFCKICQLGARQKCVFEEYFQAVSASWFGQHKSAEGRGKEWGSSRERHRKSCLASGRNGDGEFGKRGITSACSSAPTKAQGSWSRV